jgi:hypothetical protein
MRWPSLYEWASLFFPFMALIVSVLSFLVSKQTEDAQKEDVSVSCDPADDIEVTWSTDSLEKQPLEKKYYIIVAWTARITNNSRTPVNISYIDVTRDIDANSYQEFTDVAKNKRGAEHLVRDRDISVEPLKSTTVRFTADVPISPKAAVLPGIERAKDLYAANELLRVHGVGIDIFGNKLLIAQANR